MSSTQSTAPVSLSYKDAGVDIEAGDALVERIKSVARRTKRPEVMSGLGGFGALCRVPQGYRSPILVSGTDGVGTKLRLALQLDRHDQIGTDLVAMCVNDLLVCGAEPLFFLDYYATGHLNIDTAASVVAGIGAGCEQAGCSLVGGETAEMPGMYEGDDYDLAGFCVGVVEEEDIIDGHAVQAGDVLVALPSSGAHSNGYSLIRKILEVRDSDLQQPFAQGTLADSVMAPTRIYVKPVLSVLRDPDLKGAVHAMAHITGGGLPGNLPRVLPDGTAAHINTASWQWPELFTWLQVQGGVDAYEMYRTFNCGVGFVMAVDAARVNDVMDALKQQGEQPFVMGNIMADPASTTGADDRVRVHFA